MYKSYLTSKDPDLRNLAKEMLEEEKKEKARRLGLRKKKNQGFLLFFVVCYVALGLLMLAGNIFTGIREGGWYGTLGSILFILPWAVLGFKEGP